jgi:N-acetylglucosamine kinase-like BadF-type ATPase/transcriptional regulator with XRE-family HTH domain
MSFKDEELDLEKVSANINKLLKDRGLNLKKLAELANIPLTTLSPILNGKRDFRLSTLVSIADTLGVTANDLLKGSYESTNLFPQENITEPDYFISFINNVSLSYVQIFNVKKNTKESLMLPFAVFCIDDPKEIIEKIKIELSRVLGNINFKKVALYLSVLCFEYLNGREPLIQEGKKQFFKFVVEPDWLAMHKSIIQNSNGILLTINNGYALSYSTDHGKTINKRQGYGFPISDEAGNIWLGCQALKHAINVKEGLEERSLLSDKILAIFKSDLNLITTRVYDDYIGTYTEAATIVKELAKKIGKAGEIVKKGFDNMWEHIKQIDRSSSKELPIFLSGDLAYLYEEYVPAKRLKKIDVEETLSKQFDYTLKKLSEK